VQRIVGDLAPAPPMGSTSLACEIFATGGTGSNLSTGGGGGGGGAYSRTNVVSLAGVVQLVTTAGVTLANAITLLPSSVVVCQANHGITSTTATGGAGGNLAGAIGDVKHAGCAGANASAGVGGGGGGGAGSDANCAAGSGSVGGSGGAGGGNGGTGGAIGHAGTVGGSPSGGGGGRGSGGASGAKVGGPGLFILYFAI
jgi:hypothetical protein